MRETYELSDETRAVITGNVKNIAEEMGKSDKYLYAILAGTETDVFAKFKPEYAAAVRAGAPVEHWDNWMAAVRQRYAAKRSSISPADALIAKIQSDAETDAEMVKALADGQISPSEATRILQMVQRARQMLDDIVQMVLETRKI